MDSFLNLPTNRRELLKMNVAPGKDLLQNIGSKRATSRQMIHIINPDRTSVTSIRIDRNAHLWESYSKPNTIHTSAPNKADDLNWTIFKHIIELLTRVVTFKSIQAWMSCTNKSLLLDIYTSKNQQHQLKEPSWSTY